LLWLPACPALPCLAGTQSAFLTKTTEKKTTKEQQRERASAQSSRVRPPTRDGAASLRE